MISLFATRPRRATYRGFSSEAIVTPFRNPVPHPLSVFSPAETVLTLSGALPVGELVPGAQVLTTSGYAVLRAMVARPQRQWAINQTMATGSSCFDPRKLLRVQGAVVELLTGVPVALIRLYGQRGRFGLSSLGPHRAGYALRFDRPEMVITDHGCFASEDHESLPPVLSDEEAMVVLTGLRSRFDDVAA